MVTYCCGNSSGNRCYLPYLQSGYTLRAGPYNSTWTKAEFDAATRWAQGSYFTYASNVDGYVIGPGTAYQKQGDYLPYYVSGTTTQVQYRYRDRIK